MSINTITRRLYGENDDTNVQLCGQMEAPLNFRVFLLTKKKKNTGRSQQINMKIIIKFWGEVTALASGLKDGRCSGW